MFCPVDSYGFRSLRPADNNKTNSFCIIFVINFLNFRQSASAIRTCCRKENYTRDSLTEFFSGYDPPIIHRHREIRYAVTYGKLGRRLFFLYAGDQAENEQEVWENILSHSLEDTKSITSHCSGFRMTDDQASQRDASREHPSLSLSCPCPGDRATG